MKTQKIFLIFLIAFAVVSQSKLRKDSLNAINPIGGWTDLKINQGYKLDSNSDSPLNIAYKNLSDYLSKYNITNLNFNIVKSQVVNGINLKIEFSYEQDGQVKTGNSTLYIQSWTNTFKIVSIKLQEKDSTLDTTTGSWSEYKIDNNYQSDKESPLYMASQELNNLLAQKNFEFVRFDKIYSQIVSGLNLKVTFTYKINGEQKQGSCLIFVKPWEKLVQISELNIEEPKKNDTAILVGGWSNYDFQSDFQSNSQNPLNSAYTTLISYLQNQSKSFLNIIKVDKQLVSGMNYRILFTYTNLDGSESTGQSIIYVPLGSEKPQITSIKLNFTNYLKSAKEGGWSDYELNDNSINDETTSFYQANKALLEAINQKGYKFVKINKVQSQIVSGVNYKIQFSYRSHDQIKQGEALIYVQLWTKTVEIKNINFNFQN